MKSSITFGFGSNGVPLIPNRRINVMEDHPDLGDGVSWEDLISVVTATYSAVSGDFAKAGAALLPTLKKAYDGKNYNKQQTAHETFPQGGTFILHGKPRIVDDLRVVFRAESEDDLTESFGTVAQSATVANQQVQDSGEKKFSQGSTNVYVRRFAIPLKTIIPGDYVFTFGSGDDGWFFDVGHSSILTVSIAPARR